jgi:hypothetical protein
VHDARRNGATVLALDGGDRDLHALAHDALAAPPSVPPPGADGEADGSDGGRAQDLDLDTLQHLVSAAAGENSVPVPRRHRRFRDRLARLADGLTAPPPPRW